MRTQLVGFLFLVACSGAEPEPPTCEGGGEPLVEIGDGGRDAFAPFSNGDVVPTRGDPAGADLDLWTSGLDTTQGMTAIVRIAAGGPSQDSLATLTFVCADSGNGWTNVLAQLPAGATSGSTVTIDATLTDAAGTTVTAELEAVLE